MEVKQSTKDVQNTVLEAQKNGKTVGFVPTMGALHAGHLSLVRAAKAQCDYVAVSIFVNPTQFNDKNDLDKYPRTLEADLALLEKEACDLVFAPTVKDIYPEAEIEPLDIDLGVLDQVMEGEHRPGHFAGVALVVHRLFEAVPANVAFFGEKDFQQVAVIRSMVEQTNSPVKVATSPTVREADGLAMSSRNTRLSQEHRAAAPLIAQALNKAKQLSGTKSIQDVKLFVQESISANELLELEYFQIADKKTLLPAQNWDSPNGCVGCIAVWAGGVRLIDNIQF